MKAKEFNLVAKVLKSMPIKSRRKALKEMSKQRFFAESQGLNNLKPYVSFYKITDIIKNPMDFLSEIEAMKKAAKNIKDPKRKSIIIENYDKLIGLILKETND